jgi:precorrin-6B methylase 2
MDRGIHTFFRSGNGYGLKKETADQILEDLKTIPDGEDLSPLIAQRGTADYLFNLSDIRTNTAKFLKLSGDERVLEIGGGCGSVTGYFASHASSVTSVVFGAEDARVNACRNRRFANVTICAGLPEEVLPHLDETYDLITLFGVCEYAQMITEPSGGAEDACLRILKLAADHLAEGGRIVIATPNRLGLKYFAGNQDVTGHYFDSLERKSEDGAISFSRSEWTRILGKAGFPDAVFYYPYPDERLPLAIYSDDFLPSKGELCSNNQNFDSVRLYLFDETRVFDAITEENLFPEMTNGFLIIAGEDPGPVLYEKFSNERAPQFCVDTKIVKNNEILPFPGNEKPERLVLKAADTERAADHIRKIPEYEAELGKLYQETGVVPNRGFVRDGVLNLEYVTGIPYDCIVDEVLRRDGKEAALDKIGEFLQLLVGERELIPFRMTEQFETLFGAADDFSPDERSLPVTDLDLIMPNVICTGEDSYTLIDYEWTVDFPVPVRFLKYRVIHYYLAVGGARSVFSEHEVLERFGISQEDAKRFAEMEQTFQRFTVGEHVPIVKMYDAISPGNFFVQDCFARGESAAETEQESEDVRILRAEVERLRRGYDELLDLYEASQNEMAKQKEGR